MARFECAYCKEEIRADENRAILNRSGKPILHFHDEPAEYTPCFTYWQWENVVPDNISRALVMLGVVKEV